MVFTSHIIIGVVPHSGAINCLWVWRIWSEIRRTSKPKKKFQRCSNWSLNVRGNDQHIATSSVVTCLKWINLVFYLAGKVKICIFWWIWRAREKWFHLRLSIHLSSVMINEGVRMLGVKWKCFNFSDCMLCLE